MWKIQLACKMWSHSISIWCDLQFILLSNLLLFQFTELNRIFRRNYKQRTFDMKCNLNSMQTFITFYYLYECWNEAESMHNGKMSRCQQQSLIVAQIKKKLTVDELIRRKLGRNIISCLMEFEFHILTYYELQYNVPFEWNTIYVPDSHVTVKCELAAIFRCL